jgi:hypothetical protein
LTKSLPPSLFQREELPLFGKEGLEEIFRTNVFSIMDSLVSKKRTARASSSWIKATVTKPVWFKIKGNIV